MCSGPICLLVLRREDAIRGWRTLMGPTNVEVARTEAPTCIRAIFGTDHTRNATHGSDSAESAVNEIAFFFPDYTRPVPFKGREAKDFLNEKVAPTLTKALTDLCRLNPADPFDWLATYFHRMATPDAPPRMVSAPVTPVAPKKRIFFVLGGPGSGKGTQCAQLVKRFGFDHFSAGDLLRGEVAKESEQGKMIADIIKEGTIVPGHITIGLLKAAIEASTAPGVLIDGFPRQLDQAGSFEKDVSDFEFVLFFDCPEEEMEKRLLERGKTSGRSDDNMESIRKRFKTFVNTSMPVIQYYEAKGKVNRIDATKTIDEVTEQVIKLF